jgi:hypothetical protein
MRSPSVSKKNGAKAGVNRRNFLGTVGAGAAVVASGATLTGCGGADAAALPLTGLEARRADARQVRRDCADLQYQAGVVSQGDNGDQALRPDGAFSYSKGLPHDALGRPDANAWGQFRSALANADLAALAAVPYGGPVKLHSPQAGLSYDLIGRDSHQLTMAPAPTFQSAEQAGELVELYWMALVRDLHFSNWNGDADIAAACSELSGLSDFRGPRSGGAVTPSTLFRSGTTGDLRGPYISQYLLRPFNYGSIRIPYKQRTLVPGVNYMTDLASWLAVQNGQTPPGTLTLDSTERYIRNLRDLAYYARVDVSYQAFLFAAFQTAQAGCGFKPEMSPYATSTNQQGFVNFGMPHLVTLIAEVALRALKAVWYQKWFVHRRIRPEEYAGRVHVQHAGLDNFGIHGDVLNSVARQRVETMYGTSLLPMAYNEGCPPHPSYGAGHNVIAGACVTVLKAFFNENFVLPQTWVASADGSALEAYTGPEAGTLTVGEELDKLASNIAQGRNCGGVHWRSEALSSFMHGQQLAVSVMQEQRLTFTESYTIKFRGFDGVDVTA